MTQQNQSDQRYYDEHADAFFESTVNVEMQNIYSRFLPHVQPGGLIVDAGCGSGRDAKFFLQNGFLVFPFDASEALADKAADYLDLTVPVSTFDQFRSPIPAHAIWCCAALLHVPRLELPASIDNLCNNLAPDGVMYVSFKYGTTDREHNGRHFTDMTESTLKQCFDEFAQLHPIAQWITRDNRPGRENEKWINAIYKKI